MRWRLRLSEYDYEIVYKKGTVNSNADALSRNPVDETETDFDTNYDMEPNEDLDPLDPSFQDVHKVLILQDLPPVLSSPESVLDDEISNLTEIAFFGTEGCFINDSETYDEISSCDYFANAETSDNSDAQYETASEGEMQAYDSSEEAHDIDLVYWSVAGVATGGRVNASGSHNSADRSTSLLYRLSQSVYGVVPVTTRPGPAGEVEGLCEQCPLTEVVTGSSRDNCEIKNDLLKTSDDKETPHPCFLSTDVDDESKTLNSNILFPPINSIAECYPVNGNDISDESNSSTINAENENRNEDDDNEAFNVTDDELPDPNTDMSCLRTCKDRLYMRDDHLIQFLPADCKLTTETSQELIEKNKFNYDDLKIEPEENLRVGNVIVYRYDHLYVFNLIVKLTFDSRSYITHISDALLGLKHAMDALKIKTASISRVGNGLDQIPWHNIEELLRKTFGKTDYKITICYGEIEIPPEKDRFKIITEFHSSVVGGHKGSTKTYERIREHFYWPNMRQQVRDYVTSCEECKRSKLDRVKTRLPMRITDTPTEAFEKIEIDMVGPLPETERGNKYILTIQDNLTKYSDAIPLMNTESTTIAMAIAEHFIARFGCPYSIHTDQGSNFISEVMTTFCRIFKIKQIKSTAFHPQSLGSLERSHHVLIQYLKMYCKETNWDSWLRFALFSYNTSKHESTGFTPHELIFGKKARIPSEFANEEIPLTYNMFLKTLSDKLVETQTSARQRLQLAKERSKKYYDEKLNIQKYQVGEMVYLRNHNPRSKLDPQEKLGPYKITQVFNDLNVELEIDWGKYKIVHMNELRPQCHRVQRKTN